MTPAEVAYQRSAVSTTSEEELVVQELQQVYYIAARIRERLPQHVELEDLVSAGVVGLIEATRSFDGFEKYTVQDLREVPNPWGHSR